MKNNDVERIRRILAGDENAFVSLVEKYQKQVHALAWRKIGDFHIAEEITQDTFLKVYQKLSTLKDPTQFSGWLYVIATNQCRAWLRKKRIETASLEDTDIALVEGGAYSRYVADEHAKVTVEAQREVVKKLLAKLKESERTVMTLHYFGDMTCEEISRFLGVSTSAIKLRLHRARQRLQKEEPMIREALSNFQLSPNLTENIMQKVERIKPTAPSGSKPLVQWVLGASTALLIALMLGMGSQYLARFQQPYSLDSQSETTVELIDAPIVQNLEAIPDIQNQLGENSDDPGKGDGTEQESNQVLSDKGDYTEWGLPKEAKARLGKGKITGNIAYSPDGTRMAVASHIGVWIYDAQSGEEIDFLWSVGPLVRLLTNKKINLSGGEPGWITCMSFSPDSKILATGNWDHTIVLWNVTTKQQIAALTGLRNKVNSKVYSISFSADGKTLASGHQDGTVRMWNVETVKQEKVFTGHTSPVRGISFSPTDNKILVSGSWDKLRLWDVVTGENKTMWTDVLSVSFSADGKIFASGHGDNTVRLWNVATGENKAGLKGHTGPVTTLGFSPDGTTLVSGSWDKTVRLWDVTTKKHKMTLKGHTNHVNNVAYSIDGSTIVSSSWRRDGVRLWDATTGMHKITLEGHTPSVNSVAYSPDGTTIASGHADSKVRLWDAATRKLKITFTGHTDEVWCINFSPDGKTLASGGRDNVVQLWDIATGNHKKTFIGHTNRRGYENCVRSVSFSVDGQTLASASGLEVWLWDVATGQQKAILEGHTGAEVWSVSFSSDGKTIATGGSDKTVQLWDVETGEQKVIISEHSFEFDVKSVSFSPDGKTIAGSSNKSVGLWDVETRKRKAILKGHDFSVLSVSFSPDGKTIATGGSGRSVRLWNVTKKRLWDVLKKRSIATFKGHIGDVRSVSFSPDGKTIATGSSDGTILLWDLTSPTNTN